MLLPFSFWKKIHSRQWKGALFKCFSCACFVGINGLTRQIFLPEYQLICLQNLLGALFLYAAFQKFPKDIFKSRYAYFRLFFAIPGTLLWVVSLRKLPLWQTVALGFLGPFFTTLLAKVFLKEKIGKYRAFAIFLGCLGGGIVTISESHSYFCQIPKDPYLFLLPLLATLSFACCNLMGKKLGLTHDAYAMAFALMLMLGASLSLSCFFWCPMSWHIIIYLLCLGVLAAAGYMMMNKALVYSDLSFLIPFGSVRFLGTAAVGFAFYQEMPSFFSMIGMVITFLGLWLLTFEKRTK